MRRLWQEEEGQDLVEYGLLVVDCLVCNRRDRYAGNRRQFGVFPSGNKPDYQ